MTVTDHAPQDRTAQEQANQRTGQEQTSRETGRDGTGENPAERWNRNYTELLQELRVAQTGVQILFAFLLTIPFAARFDTLSGAERTVFVLTLIAAASSAALLIAPVSHHRMSFREGRKPQIVRTANILAMAGLGAMLAAIMGAVYLVIEVVAGGGWAASVTALLAGAYVFLWYVLPLIVNSRPRKP